MFDIMMHMDSGFKLHLLYKGYKRGHFGPYAKTFYKQKKFLKYFTRTVPDKDILIMFTDTGFVGKVVDVSGKIDDVDIHVPYLDNMLNQSQFETFISDLEGQYINN